MTYTLRFVPEVEDDAISGFSWYETKSPGLGDEFLRMFYACAVDISRNPLLYRKVHKEFQHCLIGRFPYAAVVPIPFFVVFLNRFQIIPEERVLASLFGSEYEAYCQHVSRWL
jgi:hypothetical protein